MSVIGISKGLSEKFDVHDKLEKSFFNKVVSWLIDWKYRRSVFLSRWLKEQVDNPSVELKKISSEIKDFVDYDRQVIEVLRYVHKNLKYVRDVEKWNIKELWNTGDETVKAGWEGDCEDGAILMYVLCRLKKIPSNRLLIMVGDVKGGGHAWLAYRPVLYPLNFVFLDWCYWYKDSVVSKRNIFYVGKKKILEYFNLSKVDSNYYNLWIAFNELQSNNELLYKFR